MDRLGEAAVLLIQIGEREPDEALLGIECRRGQPLLFGLGILPHSVVERAEAGHRLQSLRRIGREPENSFAGAGRVGDALLALVELREGRPDAGLKSGEQSPGRHFTRSESQRALPFILGFGVALSGHKNLAAIPARVRVVGKDGHSLVGGSECLGGATKRREDARGVNPLIEGSWVERQRLARNGRGVAVDLEALDQIGILLTAAYEDDGDLVKKYGPPLLAVAVGLEAVERDFVQR